LILGTRHYKGREGIKQAYNSVLPQRLQRRNASRPCGPCRWDGACGRRCAAARRTAFNVAIENPLIIVHGDTATSQVISPNTGRRRWAIR
jgi:hypothetical protein